MSSSRDEEKRICRITTELTQKKIIEEIDGKGERSSEISEYNFKDLSNVNPFYQSTKTNTTTNTFIKQTDLTNNTQAPRAEQCDFGQQFNLSQENLENRHQKSVRPQVTTKIQQETYVQESSSPKLVSEPIANEPESVSKPRRKESYELEAEKERERVEAEFQKNQERIEEELRKERERLEEEAKKQRLKLEEDARKERERIEKEMQKEKERIEQERLIEKDNELIDGLIEQVEKLSNQVNLIDTERASVEDMKNILAWLKELCIQAKYIKDTQLNDKSRMANFEDKLNELVCKVLTLTEAKIANDLGKDNFDLSKIEQLEKGIVNLDENINRTEYAFNLITNHVNFVDIFNQTLVWIEDGKEKIAFLPYETIENLISQYKQFNSECDDKKSELEDTAQQLNSELKYSIIVKTPYATELENFRTDYADKCKEIFDDFACELNDKASDIEQKAKECESFDEFKRVNQELIKLRKINEPALEKVKQEPNLEIISGISKIDAQLDELSNKLEGILDSKAVELVHYSEFVLEPSDLKLSFDNLDEKSDYYSKLQNEIDHYKDLLIDNDIFLENLRKKLNDVNLRPIEEAIRSCQTYAENISNQIEKLTNNLEDLNKHLRELGCMQELKCTDAINELNKLRNDYESKLDQLIEDLVGLLKNNLDELKRNEKDEIKAIEIQLVNLEQLANKFDTKVNKLKLNDNLQVKQVQVDLDDYRAERNEKYDQMKEEERIERDRLEKERQEALERERLEKERLEKERLEKERLEKERLMKEREEALEKERLEKERQEALEKERLEKEMLEKERLEKERQEALERERLEKERLEKERIEKEKLEKERQKALEKERLEKERLEKERLMKEREEALEKERLEKERQEALEKERLEKEQIKELEREKLEKERLKKEKAKEQEKLEKERLEEERLKNVEGELEQENDFSSAANLSKIYIDRDENDNLTDKKLKKPSGNRYQKEEPVAVVQVKMPKKARALLTNTSRMYSIEHHSEYEDSIDGEPIIELVDSDNEQQSIDQSILEEIREMLRELKENQSNSSNLNELINEMNNIRNICAKVDNVRYSKENSKNGFNEQLSAINGQLADIFQAIKEILNSSIPNIQENLPEKEAKEQSEQQLIDSINLYTEVVTEFDKFDTLINNNNDFINEIKNQLRRIDNKSLDNKLVDYRELLDKINAQIQNVNNEISSMNENLQDLRYKDSLDDRKTLDELEKLRKLCEDHFENSIEDLYISYIPKLNQLDSYLNETTQLDELQNIQESMVQLRDEINEKVNSLELNGSPLIKNLLDLVEKLNNKIASKIEDTIYKQNRQKQQEQDNLLNEQLEQAMSEQTKQQFKRPLKLSRELTEETIEFSVHKTPDPSQLTEQTIFRLHHSTDEGDDLFKDSMLQFTPPVLTNQRIRLDATELLQRNQSDEADRKLDEVLDQLKRLKDALSGDRKLTYDQLQNKMNSLIDLISTIQEIENKKPNPAKLEKVTFELNNVVDCLARLTNDYVKKVCEKENTKPENLFNNLSKKNDNLDQLLNNLKPRFESITEIRKFEKLTENNQQNVDALNRVIDELSNLPINEKVKNLKDCISNADKFTNELANDVNQINAALKCLKTISELKPNVTIEKYTEIKTTCRSDYQDLVKRLCQQARSEINSFGQILNNAKNPDNLKEIKKNALTSASNFEVEVITADLVNDLLVRETMNEFKNLNKRVDEKISRLIKENKTKSPVNAKIKKETKSHLIKSNSETLVGSPRIEQINTGNELIKFLKEMIIKLDKLIKESNRNELKPYLTALSEVCTQSNYVRENEPQLSDELNLIDKNLDIVRRNLINLITKNALENLSDWRFELKSFEFKLDDIDFKESRSTNEMDAKKIINKIELDSHLTDEYNRLERLMNETHDWIKDFECKLDYLPLRTLEELLDNYKATIFSVEILKAKIIDSMEMFNSKLEDSGFEAELISNPILEELDILKERFEIKCKELFDNFTKESMRKINEYIRKCSNCADRGEFQYMMKEVKEFDVMNTNRINKIIKSTQQSLDKLLGRLQEDGNNNLSTDEQAASTRQEANLNVLSNSLSDSNNMIYVCEICIGLEKCGCVPKLAETEVPVERKKRNTRTKRGSSARSSWNMSPEQLSSLEQQQDAEPTEEINEQLLDEHLQFEIWLEAMSGTIDFLLDEKKNLDENDFEDVVLYMKKAQQLKHALCQNFNHPANKNKAILNQYRMLYLTLEREVCILKRQVEKLRVGTAINLPIQDSAGRVICQNGVHLKHFCSRFRRNFFTRLFKITIPLQVILLTMFGISHLLPSSGDGDYRCAVTNAVRNSLGPTYAYDSHPPV